MFTLRPYQQDAVNATLNHFRKTNDTAVIVLPTGAGKSLVIAELARLARRNILVLTHVKELVEQNTEKFRQYSDSMGIKAGVFSAGLKRKDTDYQVTFASVQSLARNLDRFAREFSLVIIDECHRVNSFDGQKEGGQYGQIVAQLRTINPNLKILGLTATPYRMGLGWIYQYHYHGIRREVESPPFKQCIYELPLAYMINKGFLTPPKLIDAAVEQYDFGSLQSNAVGQFQAVEVNQLLAQFPRVTEGIVEQIVALSGERKGVMIFAATVKHAEEILGYLPNGQGAIITGETDHTTRDHTILQFKRQEIKYLVNVSVLTTGFDAPHVDFIAILRPTESVSLYQQIVGRGLRLFEGKKDCLVIDYAGNGINIFYPEIGEKKPNSHAELVQVFCPSCGFGNSFWGIKDATGKVTEHYGRRCMGVLVDEEEGVQEACDYRFRFKACEACDAENDIAARVCHACQHQMVDPDDKLKDALKLKNALVLRCSGMTITSKDNYAVVTYFDEDGAELKEQFDIDNPKVINLFNHLFKRRTDGQTPKRLTTLAQIMDEADNIRAPDFVVGRKQKRFWSVVERIFDYQGNYRKAYHQ